MCELHRSTRYDPNTRQHTITAYTTCLIHGIKFDMIPYTDGLCPLGRLEARIVKLEQQLAEVTKDDLSS